MNCSEAEELLGAYALDAVSEDEAAAMRAHLATCEEHARRPASCGRRRDTGETRGRNDAAAGPSHTNRGGGRRVATDARTSAGSPLLRHRAFDRRRRVARPTALASVVCRPGLGRHRCRARIGVAALLRHGTSPCESTAIPRTCAGRNGRAVETRGAAGHVVDVRRRDCMVVYGDALPRLDTTQTYQLWALDDCGCREPGPDDVQRSGQPSDG